MSARYYSYIVALSFIRSVAFCAESAPKQKLSLDDCIHIAMEKHQSLGISDATLEMAEAQYQQAMSAYWPQIAAQSNARRADQDTTFALQGQFYLPAAVGNALAATANNPQIAQALQQGLAKPIPINMDIKLLDRDLVTSSVNLTYPLFTGMKREAIADQAEKGVKVAEEGRRKTTLEIIRDVKKYYHAAQFAIRMEQLADDTLERFKTLEELTDRLYRHGSMKVKKTDYLRAKTTTAITRTLRSEARYAREIAHEALGNAMGQEWSANYGLADAREEPPISAELKQLIESAQTFNPELQQLKLAVQISEDQITEARSGYFPMIAFQAEAHNTLTDYKPV